MLILSDDVWEVNTVKWIVYYGQDLSSDVVKKLDVAILEPGHIQPSKYKAKKTKFVGYLSVGEVNHNRSYWSLVKGKSFLVEENENWPGAYRVDIRSKEWQDLLLKQIIPSIINKGYNGVFLDTVDTAIYLEQKDPTKYAGSKQAMIDFIIRMHKEFPDLMIIPNNGLQILNSIGPHISGVLVEDLYTRYNFENKTYTKTPIEDTKYKEKYLDLFKVKYNKPVYNVLYSTDSKDEVAKYGIKMSRSKGFHWYITTVDLMHLGSTESTFIFF